MKKLYILPLILLITACTTPRTVLTNAHGQIAVCGGDMSSSAAAGALGYYLQKQVDKECVQTYKDNGFKEKGEENSELLTQKYLKSK